MQKVLDMLLKYSEPEYASFEAKLCPTISKESCLGVRVPNLRKLAVEIKKQGLDKDFMKDLPHKYYDENLLHSILISKQTNYEEALKALEDFLPYVDNWAACDTLRPTAFKKNKDQTLVYIKKWISSKKVYTCRFGIDMLMTYYLDEDFKEEYLELPAKVISEEYYVNMMIAWYYATALAKQWDSAVVYITEGRLGTWVNNKTIQKACESFRITDEQKAFLRTYKR